MSNIDETINEYFEEWNKHISNIPELEADLKTKKEKLFDLKMKEDGKVDYNDIYGKNNDKVRDAHYKKVFSQEYIDIRNLDKSIDFAKRRIDFIKLRIKHLISLK